MQQTEGEAELLRILGEIWVSLTVDQRLSCLSLEDRLRGLSLEELERVKELVDQRIAKHHCDPDLYQGD